MTTNSDFDRRAAAFLADGPTELADRVLDAALREVHQTPQRRRWSTPWRGIPMRTRWSTAAAFAIVALAGVMGTVYLVGLGPSARQTPGIGTAAPSATPMSVVDTSNWTPFSSQAFGYDARYPQGWQLHAAASSPAGSGIEPPPTLDTFVQQGESAGSLAAWSVRIPEGMSNEQWSAAYVAAVTAASGGEACYSPRESWEPIQIDTRPGWLYHGCNSWVEAEVFASGRAYVFAAADGASADGAGHARENLLAFVSTIRLRPEAVVEATPTQAAPTQATPTQSAIKTST